jgi:hypothetical protein
VDNKEGRKEAMMQTGGDMTRRDWWLGVLLVLVALVIQTLVLIYTNREAIKATSSLRLVPTVSAMLPGRVGL